MNQSKVAVLIPAYNVDRTISALVQRVKAKGLDVIVVDDGSADQTATLAKEAGADVLTHRKNKGKGASLIEGFGYILSKDYDAVITMDGDDQHSPEDIPQLINRSANPEVDMVVGNRMLSSKEMPPIRWITNNLTSFLISIICWRNMPDSQCGFRLIKKNLLRELNLISCNYEIESEMIIEAHSKGFKIEFVPVAAIYARQISRINPVIDTIRFFRLIFKTFCPFLFNKNK